jgi:hypothetical protein
MGGPILRKHVLSSIAGEGCSCRSKTKDGRRTAPNQKLFTSKRRLHIVCLGDNITGTKITIAKTVLGSRPGEDGLRDIFSL